MTRKFLLLAVLAALSSLAARCGEPPCTPLSSRCVESEVQICDPNGHWRTQVDCHDVESDDGADWVCVQTPEVAICEREDD